MRPEILLVSEMIDAAEQARLLADGVTALELERDRQRRDASSLRGCATGSYTATGRSISRSCTRPRPSSYRSSSTTSAQYSPC